MVMTPEQRRARFDELRASPRVTEEQLDALWEILEAVRAEDILGDWKGSGFNTGHRMNDALTESRWYGKHLKTVNDVDPIVCYDDDGNLFSNTELSKGAATLWDIEFRGEVTATMVYDGQPIFDHFKRVDANTLVGVMNGKRARERGNYYYFVLEKAD
ncbi:hypothetical protein MBRU_00285 [Mycolicibacterium brumae DSM 44177]|nr:hypothetical protein MBRU_00285 [Mycolicibacterium brumae DSM 44177]